MLGRGARPRGVASVAPWEVGTAAGLVLLASPGFEAPAPRARRGGPRRHCRRRLRAVALASAARAPGGPGRRGDAGARPVHRPRPRRVVARPNARRRPLGRRPAGARLRRARRRTGRGAATLYGGPSDLARGRRARGRRHARAAPAALEPADGDPRPAEARRGVVRTGAPSTSGGCGARALHRSPHRPPARAGPRPDRRDVRPRPRAHGARARPRRERPRAGRRPELPRQRPVAPAGRLRDAPGPRARARVRCSRRASRGCEASRRASTRAASPRSSASPRRGSTPSRRAPAARRSARRGWRRRSLAARASAGELDAPRAFGLSLGAMAAARPACRVRPLVRCSRRRPRRGSSPSRGRSARRLAARAPPRARATSRAPWRPRSRRRCPARPSSRASRRPCPSAGVLANLVAVPLGESRRAPALPRARLARLVAGGRARVRARVASGALVLVRPVARVFAAPALTADVPRPTSWQLARVAVGAGVALARSPACARRAASAAARALAALLELAGPTARGAARACFARRSSTSGRATRPSSICRTGEAMVVDGGGLVGSPIDVGARVLAPELRARRRTRLAAVVLTPPAPGPLRRSRDGARRASRSASSGTRARARREGVGGGYARPPRNGARAGRSGPASRRPVRDPRARRRRDSKCSPRARRTPPSGGRTTTRFVLRITYGERGPCCSSATPSTRRKGALLAGRPGDSCAPTCSRSVTTEARTSSTPAFLAAVAPREAIVSVGSAQPVRPPAARDTLAALARAGCAALAHRPRRGRRRDHRRQSLDVRACRGRDASAGTRSRGAMGA